MDFAGVPVPVRICGGGDDLNLKQRLLAINTQLGICFAASRRVSHSGGTAASPRQIPSRAGAGARSRAVCSPIRACQCAKRRPPQIATAPFVPGPSGMVAREAAPGTACADRSTASTAVGRLVACNQNPWLGGEVTSYLYPFLSLHEASGHRGRPGCAF